MSVGGGGAEREYVSPRPLQNRDTFKIQEQSSVTPYVDRVFVGGNLPTFSQVVPPKPDGQAHVKVTGQGRHGAPLRHT